MHPTPLKLLVPTAPMAGPDRRQEPRRAAEVKLHYAEVGLLAAALAVADHRGSLGHGGIADGLTLLRQLDRAADTYRAAEAEAATDRIR